MLQHKLNKLEFSSFLTFRLIIMKLLQKIFVLFFICFSSVSYAQTKSSEDAIKDTTDSHLTAKVSTMGFGLEYNHPINSVLSVGVGFNTFGYDVNGSDGDVDSNAEIDFKSLSIIANYHPFENGFRLRGGAYINKNEINFSATPSKLTQIGNDKFNVSGNGSISFDTFSPYIGIGYGSEPSGDNRLSFDFDIGVMKTSPSLDLNLSCQGDIATVCADFDSELEAEKKTLNDDFDKFDIYPVISFGLTYRF